MQDSNGANIPFNGNPGTGLFGPGSVNVAPEKCVTVVYHFICCPRSGGTFACGGTGAVTYEEADADC